jgi:hypothetical protein
MVHAQDGDGPIKLKARAFELHVRLPLCSRHGRHHGVARGANVERFDVDDRLRRYFGSAMVVSGERPCGGAGFQAKISGG